MAQVDKFNKDMGMVTMLGVEMFIKSDVYFQIPSFGAEFNLMI